MELFFFAIFLVRGWGWSVSPAHFSALYEHFSIPRWRSEGVLAPGHFPKSGKITIETPHPPKKNLILCGLCSRFLSRPLKTSTSSCPVAAPAGHGRYCSQAERRGGHSERPHSPAAREGSEKNPERRTDVSQTTDGGKSYTEDEDFANMWQPTSERLQVWRANTCRETDAHFPPPPAIQPKNSPERRPGETRRGSRCSCRCFVSQIFHMLWSTCSAVGAKSANRAAHAADPAPLLASRRHANAPPDIWVYI